MDSSSSLDGELERLDNAKYRYFNSESAQMIDQLSKKKTFRVKSNQCAVVSDGPVFTLNSSRYYTMVKVLRNRLSQREVIYL